MIGIKLDMEKAYDRLDWTFIYNTFINICFPIKFTNLTMKCVTTVSFSILISDFSTYYFQPSRGIR